MLVAVPLLAGCSAGFDATSIQPYAASDGINAESGDISVLNALVVAGEPSTTGVISTTIANRGERDDRLTGVTSPDATVTLDGTRDLPAGSTVLLGSGTDTSATLRGLTRLAGETVTLEFSFARAEPVTVRTVVMAATGDYADLTPPPEPTPSP
jgi:copper(I)-binding protein